MSEGKKLDQGKPRMDLVPPYAEAEVAKVLTFGANKYSPDNWRKVPDLHARYQAAARRHINALARGEKLDPESGLHHAAHAACCLMFLAETDLQQEKGADWPEDEQRIDMIGQNGNTGEHYCDLGPWVHDWARWRAVDENGEQFEYECEPYEDEDFEEWLPDSGQSCAIDRIDLAGRDWRKTREKRPGPENEIKREDDVEPRERFYRHLRRIGESMTGSQKLESIEALEVAHNSGLINHPQLRKMAAAVAGIVV